jgi:hypothetical protein
MKDDLKTAKSGRRDFLKTVVLGTAVAGAATTFLGDVERKRAMRVYIERSRDRFLPAFE